ncbi:PD-(D/E)XK motif protein [Micromonospora sp. LOL_027]|uniref:PD-(D/E)XK motif protein n=1 Tax=Micromonospora sp. LOL_027 TaxID=3345419 RepID=UPI003A890396
MTVTEDDWRQLESEQHGSGLVTRRLHPRSAQDIFLAVAQPSGRRMLVLRVPSAVAAAQARRGELPTTRGLDLRFVPAGNGRHDLQVVLATTDRHDVFNALIGDMADTARNATDAAVALRDALERFEQWRHLLQMISDAGLDATARRGLYGELVVLRDHLLTELDAAIAVRGWTGPSGTHQDFQLDSVALEVKVSAAGHSQEITIANERQLDETGVGQLLLVHLSVDERRGGSGESLNNVVDTIGSAVTGVRDRAVLRDSLTRAGYLSDQGHLYDEPRYTLRKIDFWRVAGDFPRVIESDLRPGVGNCRYRLSTVGLDRYRVSAEQVARIVRGEQ